MDSNGNNAHNMQNSGDICRDYLRKVCNRGQNCKFLHPVDAEKKLEFCHDYQNSICKRRDCKFIHCTRDDESFYLEKGALPSSVDEIGSRGSNIRGRPSAAGIGLCRDFLNGKCTRGAKCKFRHQSEGDLEYERMQVSPGGPRGFNRGGWEGQDDFEYGYERSRRMPAMGMGLRPAPRFGRAPASPYAPDSNYLDFESSRTPSVRSLEDDNARLRQKLEVLRKKVDDLTSTNEVLLQQNAQLRTGKAEVAQVQLAMYGE